MDGREAAHLRPLEAEGAAQAFGSLPPSALGLMVAPGEQPTFQGWGREEARILRPKKLLFSSIKFTVQQDKFSDLGWEILIVKLQDKSLFCGALLRVGIWGQDERVASALGATWPLFPRCFPHRPAGSVASCWVSLGSCAWRAQGHLLPP